MLKTQAGHSTQLPGVAPDSCPRIATKPASRWLTSLTAMASSNHPTRFPGRRTAINTPRVPTIDAWRKNGSSAVDGESIARQSRASRMRLATMTTRQTRPIPQASRTARRSMRAVIKETISRARWAVEGASLPMGEWQHSSIRLRTTLGHQWDSPFAAAVQPPVSATWTGVPVAEVTASATGIVDLRLPSGTYTLSASRPSDRVSEPGPAAAGNDHCAINRRRKAGRSHGYPFDASEARREISAAHTGVFSLDHRQVVVA